MGKEANEYSGASIRPIRLSREYLQFLISKSLFSIPDVNSGDLKLVSPSNNNLSDKVGIIDLNFEDNTHKIYKKLPDYISV